MCEGGMGIKAWGRTALCTTMVLALGLALCLKGLGAAEADGGAGAAAKRANVPEGRWIHIDLSYKTLTLYQGVETLKRYTIASGAYDTPSPIGQYRVSHRFAGELGGFGTRFLGLNVPWGKFGIHGTNKPGSIGSNASHGCIRMFIKDSEALYAAVPNGTRVVIEGGPYGLLDTYLRPLAPGDRNNHVAAVQSKLRALGYYWGSSDGVFGAGTQQAVRAARKALGLPVSNGVDAAFYRAIGLVLFE